ncbi:uncharacterized protein [Primulina eburnea]|uniref:uncharacterized protein n=1 Tax=Primulina eburnea TaxID=1245227 RepID=UPI003C6C4588
MYPLLNWHTSPLHRELSVCHMPGGSSSKPPHPSFSAPSNHRKSRWESSSSTAAAASADRKSSAAPKSKPSPNHAAVAAAAAVVVTTAASAPSSKDTNSKPSTQQSIPRPENPSARPDNPNSLSGQRPVFPFNEPPPPPSYGFHMLDRRSIVLADGSVRSYFALPPDYQNFTPMPRLGFRPQFRGFGFDRPPFPITPEFPGSNAWARVPEFWNPGPENSLKRKFGEDERGATDDGFERQRQQLLQYGNANGPGPSSGYNFGRGEEMRASKNPRTLEGNANMLKHSEVDQNALKKAFFHFLKLIFETTSQKKNYLGDGKQGSLRCLACIRASNDFPDMHSLIMHAYNLDTAESIVDHLAFHKALCILMGWNYLMPPDNSKVYQKLSSDDAEANQDDLIMWPPSVLIHNTITGKGRDGRLEGLGNKAMDSILRDLGFPTAKSMSMHSREGHLGIHTVKFPGDESGLKEALRLAEYFEKQKHGRKAWAHVKPSVTLGKNDENNPNLVKLDSKSGEKTRVLYGNLGTVADLDKVTFEIKKKVTIVSRREFERSK